MASLSGVMQPQGTVSSVLKKTAANVTGGQRYTGIITSSLHITTSSLTGKLIETGTIAAHHVNWCSPPPGGTTRARYLYPETRRYFISGTQIQTGSVTVSMRNTVFTGQGKHIQSGNLTAQIHAVTVTMAGAEMPLGQISVTLENQAFAAEGFGGIGTGTIHAALRALIIIARHLVTPSVKRTVVIAGETRITVVAGYDRVASVAGDDRSMVIAGDPRVSTTSGENRTTVVSGSKHSKRYSRIKGMRTQNGNRVCDSG